MSSIISALDSFTPSQIGENGSIEYSWSHDIREKICQLSFQLTRTRDVSTINNLALQTENILLELIGRYKAGTITRELYLQYMTILYKMVGQTRDIIDGKGEYALSYMLLSVWNKYFPKLAQFALRHFVLPPEDNTNAHPYGCWKDIKYLYKVDGKGDGSGTLIQYGISLVIEQLKVDIYSEHPSLAAKWVPREKSKYSDLFGELAVSYFPHYILTAKTDMAKTRAIKKAKMEFRKIISELNKKLDTVQIKQCGQSWASIDPTKQTSITLKKQKRAFLNKTKTGEQRSELEDRIECANHFQEFAEKARKGEIEVKGKRVGLNDFTEEALKYVNSREIYADEIALLNAQWLDNSKQTGDLGKMVAMVDTSGSMAGDPLHAAIALGIRVAEKSILGKRVLTFSANPTWVNLDGNDTFVDMVTHVYRAEWGMNTNFYAALTMILSSIIDKKLSPEVVEDMVLAIFSDMQMDSAQYERDPQKAKSLLDTIEKSYAAAGERLWGKPFKPPHILFWNLRSTTGFPTLSTQPNCSMMSGFSPALLNLFCEKGLTALESCSPWSMLVDSLAKERYNVLEQYILENL